MLNIYLFKTHITNFTNLAVALFVNTLGSLAEDSCQYSLSNKFFTSTPGFFNNAYSSLSADGIRNIDWGLHINILKDRVSRLTPNHYLVFGNHHNTQINFLKNTFDEKIFTIGINYDTDQYPILLKNTAEYHIFLLKTNQLTPNDSDLTALTSLSDSELITHYSRIFDDISLVPKQSFIDCDYNINVGDFFNKNLLIRHFNNLGWPLTTSAEVLYDQWLSSQTV